MKLFWCPRTRSVRAVWMLEEVSVDYERILIDVRNPEVPRDAEFRAASPMGKVPALIDGAAMLADSAAICLYIADRYASGSLAPAPDQDERAAFLYWMFFAPGTMEPAMAEKMGGWQPNRGAHGWGDFDAMIETLEYGLEAGPWLLGDRFSAADVMVGSTAAFMRMFGIMPESTVIGDYIDRCLARTAYRKAMSLES